ncbi:nucleotide exchange factor GrpE [Gemmatimonas sp.]|jgi:molecular chaperone GrpE|uniref:nucleotide exchange factor GrpE n=1 Tax=Gemmatimonas sp. TaxID=1962908 RepID=UPI0037BE96A0
MTDDISNADAGLDPALEGEGAEQASATDGSADDRQREIDDLKDKHLRLAAEYDNFRRRAVKERQEAGWRAQGELVRGLIDAIDDITRFAHVDPTTVDSKTVVDGVLLVEKKLFKSLAGHGFEVVVPTGHAFDPNLHEAVSTAPASAPEEDGTVAVCFQAGYVINGLVLRPARVIVKQWTGA